MPVSGKTIVKMLLLRGWRIKHQRGSHVKLFKGDKTVIVPSHGNRDLGIGLIRAIERQSGEEIL